MREAWRFIRSGHVSGAHNMAIDEAMMQHVREGGPPTLRLYGWEPAAVSLGYFQDAPREVDEAVCRSLGIDVVRRLTGGRAILHDVEVTYSLVIREDHPLIPRSVTESYRVISEGLMQGLANMGLAAEMTVPPRRGGSRLGRGAAGDTSPACFDAPSWYEVTVNGKKIIGSAQVRRQGVMLQHGSIPLDLDAEKLFTILRFRSPEARERAKRLFIAKATSVRAELNEPVSFMQLSDALLTGITDVLPVSFVEDELTKGEQKLSDQLIKTRYATSEWNAQGKLAGQEQLV